MAIELFQIEWTKLYPFDKALNQSEAKEGGVYALYKSKGEIKKLHYIGKSRDFMKRFGFHKQNTAHILSEAERKKCYVCFGLISTFEKSRMSCDVEDGQLRDAESYLINAILPEGNDPSTKKGYKGNPIIVINGGKLTKPFESIMSHNPELLKILSKKTAKKKNSSDSLSF